MTENGREPREWLSLIVLALIFTGLVAHSSVPLVEGHRNFALPADHHKYITMAEGSPWDFHIAPFCWRILVPTVASALPFDVRLNFLIIAFVSVWLTGILVYQIIRRLGFSSAHGLIAMIMFYALGYAGKFVLYDFWLPDATTFLFVTLAVYAIVRKSDGLFVVALLVGATVKESVLFVVPLYYSMNTTRIIDMRLLGRTVMLSGPAVIALLAIRWAIPALNDNPAYLATLPDTLRLVARGSSHYGYWSALKTIGLDRLRDISALTLYLYSFGTFGVLAPVCAFFAAKEHKTLFYRLAPFMVLVYSKLFFAVDDSRLLIVGFVAVIMLAIYGIDLLVRRWQIPVSVFVPLAMFNFGSTILTQTHGPSSPLALLVHFAVLFSFLFALVMYRMMNKREGALLLLRSDFPGVVHPCPVRDAGGSLRRSPDPE